MSKFSEFNFKGQKALMRVDFNLPMNENLEITDDSRMKSAIPTIKKILADGGSVILMSHLGRPKGKPNEKYSLKHMVKHLSELLGIEVKFSEDCIGEQAKKASEELKTGEVLLLENLRFYKEEEEGDEAFAKKLSELGDIYVNDAFGTAHRAHASTTVVAKFFPLDKKMFGYLMEKEVESGERLMHAEGKPFTAVIGGAKVSDKILILQNLLDKATDIVIGGAMAYTFIKAQGGKVGNSRVEDDRLETASQLLKDAESKGVCIHLPSDSIIADKFDANANTSNSPSNNIPDGWMGLDIGPYACEQFANVIKRSKTVFWNGPMGVFEWDKFKHGTVSIAEATAEATTQGAFSLIGGGDSVAAVFEFGFADKVSYVSTGGGALLEFFEGKELPGIVALK
jgi:phosphoglycerate kinase